MNISFSGDSTMVMAEQPLKKQKLYESPPLTGEEEIMRRRRNKEEIRSLVESYNRIKFCVSHKHARLMPDLEQAYLQLITASRGCTSVQRIVADLIPRYASYCPTALEAAAKVVINMHNWSLAVIIRGEDVDTVAFQTAKACVFGLVDICHTASLEAPTSSVIRGICSAVFQNVLTFFISSLEGVDLFHIVNKDILKMKDSTDLFSEFKQRFVEEDEPPSVQLSKFRALSLLWIFFHYPKNVLRACFELFESSAKEGVHHEGRCFLNQVTSRLDDGDVVHSLDNNDCDRTKSPSGSVKTGIDSSDMSGDVQLSNDNHVQEVASPVSKKCLLGMVFGRDMSLRSWIVSRVKKLCQSASPEVASEITSVLEGVFESFTEQVKAVDGQVDSDEDDLNPSKYISGQFSVPKISNQHETSSEISEKDKSYPDSLANKFQGKYLKNCISVVPPETDHRSNTSPSFDSGGPRSMDVEFGDLSRARSSTPRDPLTNQMVSPVPRKHLGFRSSSFDGKTRFGHIGNNQVENLDHSLPALKSSSGGVIWYTDGDPEAMDIFSASRQLYLGSLGPDASEALVRFQFEKFGPIDQFLYYPFKRFALIEFRYIMDAIKAREVMRVHSPWGTHLRIKFLDAGLGTRGDMNGVAVGFSCHVYIGNLPNQRAKEEILHEVKQVIYKLPCIVTDLASEGALLMEFETPEDATIVMTHLRQHRKENSYRLSTNVGPTTDNYRARISSLSSLLMSLRAKCNIPGNYQAASMREEDRSPTSNLWVNFPNNSPLFLTDDEVVAVCNLAISSRGSVVRLNRTNVPIGSGWFVECSSIDAAKDIVNNLRGCPGNFLQIEFSHSGKHHAANPASNTSELPSSRMDLENHGTSMHSGHAFHSNWTEVGGRKVDGYDNNMVLDPAQRGNRVVSGPTEQMWMYRKSEIDLCSAASAPGNITFIPTPTQGPAITPPRPVQLSPFMRPVYHPANGLWHPRSFNHPPLNPIPQAVMLNSHMHNNATALPFLPASVTPLAYVQGNPTPQFGQMFSLPAATVAPPIPSPPPPLPDYQPPLAPPPPPSSPPPLHVESSNLERTEQCPPYHWQGTLSKSGILYCTINALRMDSDICKYSSAVSEPTEWPEKLDMTKRTDFRHVKTTFSSTPPHKFGDFISYLKQRECAGVIKIPAAKSVWARLLFILPFSPEICSMLGVAPNPSDSLIALVLPKETNLEWAAKGGTS